MAGCPDILGCPAHLPAYQRLWRETPRYHQPSLHLLDWRHRCRRARRASSHVQEQKERRVRLHTFRCISERLVSTFKRTASQMLTLHRADGWSFCIGLLQATFTLTGYGMVAVMCEEVQNPEREVPRAMVLSVVASGLTGIVYLVPILFVLPDIAQLLTVASGQPIGILFKEATGSAAAGLVLLLLIIGIMFFACIGAMTTASRCAYALARDKAIPGSKLWRRVNDRFGVPLMALLLTVTVVGLMGLIYLGSSAAFNAFTGATTICLSACFVSPVLISLLHRRRGLENSPYPLGRFGYTLNIISVGWVALALVLFCMPVSIPVTASSMNYTSVVFCGFGAISVVWYYIRGRKEFTGPPTRELLVLEAEEPEESIIARARSKGTQG